jgi:hypothetical protein
MYLYSDGTLNPAYWAATSTGTPALTALMKSS